MPAQPLHPNLARLAAAYDNIIERYSRREINPTQARSDILALIARDDNGTQWSIDPDSGQWCYRNRKGQLIPSDPPSYGLATPTAHDLSSNPNAFNPDSKIQFQEIDESLLHPPNSLLGATRRRETKKSLFAGPGAKRNVIVLAVVAVLAVATFWFSSSDDGDAPAEGTAPVSTEVVNDPAAAPPAG